MMNVPTPPLAGKRALVTGAARGIGAAIALKLAEDGADVAITDERSAEKAEAIVAEIGVMGRRAIAIQADAASADPARAAVEQTVADLGGLDILSTMPASCWRVISPHSHWTRSIFN
jgi:NAD(P)-dependent dehydrogenase (short-subunit alcohol dehydrogenase family)